QAEDGIRDRSVTGVQTCALPILHLPQGLDHQGVALASARRAPVQGFRLGPFHKSPLPGLGLPDHRRLPVHNGSSFPSPAGGSSTTPYSLPALPPSCSPRLLATAARSLSTAVISFSAFMSPSPSSRLRASRAFASLASRPLKRAVVRCRSRRLPFLFCAIRSL